MKSFDHGEGKGGAVCEISTGRSGKSKVGVREGGGQTRAELIFAGGPWQSCERADPPLPSLRRGWGRQARTHLCQGYGVAGGAREDAEVGGRRTEDRGNAKKLKS
jgi:hypothetical protein